MTGVKVEPFVTTVNNDGTIGYYSVFYVRADSPYKTIDDLKGKNLGLVDPELDLGQQRAALRAEQAEAQSRDLLRHASPTPAATRMR